MADLMLAENRYYVFNLPQESVFVVSASKNVKGMAGHYNGYTNDYIYRIHVIIL